MNINYIPASEINYGVYFQFTPTGSVCCANNRYSGQHYRLLYFMNNRLRIARYKNNESASKRYLILREDINASAPQRNRLKIKTA